MFDLRPVGYFVGLLAACFGVAMAAPLAVDLFYGNEHWKTFAISGVLVFLFGTCLALSTKNSVGDGLTVKQTFLLITSVFALLPVFAAFPLVFGDINLSFTDAFFEAMSGLTTTGSTIMSGLDDMPKGILLWRGMLQWFGGISIVVVALVFLPLLRVGGMQLFRWDSYDTLGTVLHRAAETTQKISIIYLVLSLACFSAYLISGLSIFDAVVYTMTTVATCGFGNYDNSFETLGVGAEYVCVVFMILASLPFLFFHQISQGHLRNLLSSSQATTFFLIICVVTISLVLWQVGFNNEPLERAFRQSLFNGVSILTGTGFTSADYGSWGSLPVVIFLCIGLIGGCAGSTSCSVKVFRYQLLIAATASQLRKIRTPRAVIVTRYEGAEVSNSDVRSVVAFFLMFLGTLAVAAVLLAMTGEDFITSLSGAATALTNVGPGLGPVIGPEGNFSELNNSAKWVLAFTMLVGRLELTVVYAVLSIRFWQ